MLILSLNQEEGTKHQDNQIMLVVHSIPRHLEAFLLHQTRGLHPFLLSQLIFTILLPLLIFQLIPQGKSSGERMLHHELE